MKITQTLFSILAALAILLSACSPGAPTISKSNVGRDKSVNAPASELSALTNGNNAFAFDLYRSLGGDGNLIFSPYSISLALAMTYAGARGETESQMANTLHFSLPQDQLHPAFNALDLALAQSGKATSKDVTPLQLNIANAVWAEQTFPFQQTFLDTLARNYGAGIQLADFVKNYEAVRKQINSWVSKQTKDKIKDLIQPGVLNADTRMALVNAIYFKADWRSTFEKESTHDADFHLLDGTTVGVPTMHQDETFPYAKGDGWQAIELPYAGGSAAMDILVPDEGNFAAFASSLDLETVSSILGNLQPTYIELALPKFKFESQFSLTDQLSALGMSDAFDPNRADFSGMTGKPDLYISAVIHKAFVAVDEKGTEAAAATAVIMELAVAQVFTTTLTIDRPFIFLIRDTTSGQILFVGQVTNPK